MISADRPSSSRDGDMPPGSVRAFCPGRAGWDSGPRSPRTGDDSGTALGHDRWPGPLAGPARLLSAADSGHRPAPARGRLNGEISLMPAAERSGALDHIVVVLFENRSFDNVLGRLYDPAAGRTFDGVIGKDLGNPIPAWAEHGAERKVVPYAVASDMDSPNPDSGEEYSHTNTQLYGALDE